MCCARTSSKHDDGHRGDGCQRRIVDRPARTPRAGPCPGRGRPGHRRPQWRARCCGGVGDRGRSLLLVRPLRELADALGAPEVGRTAGAVAPVADRLTLTVEEAAALLGISRAFAYEAVRRGEIPSIRIGRRVLVPKAALERLVGSVETPETSADEPI
jgi:excisionase family DNA binding protein